MLTILTTHPIQYQVPLWQALARDGCVPFEVWYLTDHGTHPTHDREFKKAFAWDIDTLSGYPNRFLEVQEGATPSSFWKCRLRESLRDRLRDSNARVLWIQGWQVAAYWQAVWEAKRARVEVWLRGESNDLAPIPLWKRGIKRAILGQFFRRVDRFLYIGSANRRLYRKFGVPEDRLYPSPYAVDNERFARQADAIRQRRTEIRRRWKIPDDAFCILFCGKFIPKKRPFDLVKAVRILIGDGRVQTLHLLFVGSGELGSRLRTGCRVVWDAEADIYGYLQSDNSQVPNATFAGFLNQTEISTAYVAADCLVLPSDHGETWGLVVNEAMASGLPCIMSSACGCAEDLALISGNHTSFGLGDIGSLATKILELLKKPRSGKQLQAAIRRNSFESTLETVKMLYPSKELAD